MILSLMIDLPIWISAIILFQTRIRVTENIVMSLLTGNQAESPSKLMSTVGVLCGHILKNRYPDINPCWAQTALYKVDHSVLRHGIRSTCSMFNDTVYWYDIMTIRHLIIPNPKWSILRFKETYLFWVLLCPFGDWESHLWQTCPDTVTDMLPRYFDPSSSVSSIHRSDTGVSTITLTTDLCVPKLQSSK